MNEIYSTLLEIIRYSIRSGNQDQKLDFCLREKALAPLLFLAEQQKILSLVCDGITRSASFKGSKDSAFTKYRDLTLISAGRQITQSNEFLTLILHAQNQDLDPVVIKGIICRSLYPQPYLRPSVDEDILVLPEEAGLYHRFFLSEGLTADDPDADPMAAAELSYHKENSPTYIELQKALFEPDSEVFGNFNTLFSGMMDRTVRIQIEDVSVRTLAPTDHFLYLILHAFKHFVHSGIGIRSVCDIGMSVEHYASEIDWNHIQECLDEVNAFDFACALLRIVQLYLLPDADFYAHITDWNIDKIDVGPLLEDILASGVHGNSSLERLHSSNITLEAVVNDKKSAPAGKGFLGTALHSVFLPIDKMSVRYHYLKKAPFLLPVAWGQRIGGYLKEKSSSQSGTNSSSESIRLGQSRVELLKKYGIIR